MYNGYIIQNGVESVDRRTSGEQIADVIRQEILLGRMEDCQELNQVELANMLGISRMPVRDALKQLENECFVERLDNRHTRVIGVTEHGRISRYRLFTALVTEAMLSTTQQRLQQVLDSFRMATSSGAAKRHVMLHHALFACCQDRFVVQIYRRLFSAFISVDFQQHETRLCDQAAEKMLLVSLTENENVIHDAASLYYKNLMT